MSSLRVFHNHCLLRFAARVQILDAKHPSRELYTTQQSLRPLASVRLPSPLAHQAKDVALDWGLAVSALPSKLVLRSTAVRRSFEDWKKEGKGNSLQALRAKPGRAWYLKKDSRAVAALRARLRLDRSALNDSQFRRGMLSEAAADCPSCVPSVPETTEHALLHCSLFDSDRAACARDLGVALSVPILLAADQPLGGDPEDRSRRATVSGKFLLAIHSLRVI
jgi:hypothetical protein